MREKLLARFGSVGRVLWQIITLCVSVLPLVAIGGPWWLTVLLAIAVSVVPLPLDIPLWLWGLIRLICVDPTGVFSIVYYVLFGVVLALHVIEFVIITKSR